MAHRFYIFMLIVKYQISSIFYKIRSGISKFRITMVTVISSVTMDISSYRGYYITPIRIWEVSGNSQPLNPNVSNFSNVAGCM